MKNDLNRFLEAQDDIFQTAVDELESECKQTHWMWFIFPQLYGLGHSENSKKYGIRSLDEAREYLNHATLGPRLMQVTLLIEKSKSNPVKIFGEVDYQKFISCMTLFMLAAPENSIFAAVLQRLSAIDITTKIMLGGNHDSL